MQNPALSLHPACTSTHPKRTEVVFRDLSGVRVTGKNHTKNSFPKTISVLALMASPRAEVSAHSPTREHTSHKALQTQVHSMLPSGPDGSQLELSVSSDHNLQCLQCQASGFQPRQINGTGISLPPPSGNSTRPSKGLPSLSWVPIQLWQSPQH